MNQRSSLTLSEVIIVFSRKGYRTLSDTFGHFRIFCRNAQRVKEMNFVKLFEILNNNRPAEPSDYAFFMKLIDKFITPQDPNQTVDKNPFSGINQDTVERYIRGQKSFNKKRLRETRRMRNLDGLATFIGNYFDDTQKYNIETDIQKIIPDFNNNRIEINYPLAYLFSDSIDEVIDTVASDSPSEGREGLASEYYYDHTDKKIHIGGNVIELPPELTPPDDIDDEEITYVNELLKAYADASGTTPLTIDEISKLTGKYKINFTEQRINYYSAVRICRIIRDAYANPEEEMKKWKSQTFDYISDTYRDDYENGYKRLVAVLKKVVESKTTAAIEGCNQLIQPKERKGVCHLLVNDGDITWIQEDE